MGTASGSRLELLKGNFLLLVTSSFLFVMSLNLLVPMLPRYLGSIGALETEVGFIIGLVPLVAVLTSIPVGRFIDRRGRRGMLILGTFLQAASPLLYTLCTDTTQFMAVRALNGLGLACYLVTAQTIVVDISPRGRLGETLGIYSISFLAGLSIGPSVSGLLLSSIGYTSTFYIAGLVGLTGAIIAMRIAVPPATPSKVRAGSFVTVLRNRNLTTASLAIAVTMIPFGVVVSFLPLYAAGMDVGPEGVGLYFTVFALCTGVTRPFIGALSDRVGRVAVAVPFTLLASLGVSSFVLAGDLPGLLASGAILGTGMGGAVSSLSALSMDTTKPELRGQAVAISRASTDLGISIGAMSMGPVIMLGGYSMAFASAGVIILAGIVAFLAIRGLWKKEEKIYT